MNNNTVDLSAGLSALSGSWRASPLATAMYWDKSYQCPGHLRVISDGIVDAYAGRGPKFLAIAAPPRCGKSKLLSHWTPIFGLSQNPASGVLFCSYSDDYAQSAGRGVKNWINEHTEDLGFGISEDSHAAGRWNTSAGGWMSSQGVQGQLLGKGTGPGGLLIIDDPYKDYAEASNPTVREKVKDWWFTTARSRIEQASVVILSFQRWDVQDLRGFLENSGEVDKSVWRFLEFPARWTHEFDDALLGRAKGSVLWPSMFDDAAVTATEQAIDRRTWASVYQQAPLDLASDSRCLSEYDEALHVADLEYTPHAPILIGMDFNVDPGTAVICQLLETFEYPDRPYLTNHKNRVVHVLDELTLPNSNTRRVCEELWERLQQFVVPGFQLDVRIAGDASGAQRKSSATDTDWQIVKKWAGSLPGVRAKFMVQASNPAIKASITKLDQAFFRKEILVDRKCTELRADLKDTCWLRDSAGRITSGLSGGHHLLDCLRYAAWKTGAASQVYGEQCSSPPGF